MSRLWRGRAAIAACVVAVSGLAWAAEPPSAAFDAKQGIKTSDSELSRRLADLCEKLEKKRIEQHIAGMAMAIVKDDQVVLARGFGERDIQAHEPADAQTLYAIGSQTKAFTTMLVSMLADEGKMTWDDPVRTHVKDFHLFDKDADAVVTLRDLCSHRTGLPRTDLLWASGKASKQQMMERLAYAEPTGKFREVWQYNNTMLMVAGMAAGNAAGSDWPTLIQTRIFTPLGMKDSDTDIHVMQKQPHASKGYKWDEDAKEIKPLPMRYITCDGAGAINSTADDMSRWLRMLLGKGRFEGKRLVSEQMLDQMWTKQMEIGAGMSYGLGWMLHDWNGKHVVEHGGNIDGFFTACAMLPDEHLGFVLMGTLTASGLQQESLNMVWETFFPPVQSTDGAMTEAQLQPYLGKYRADVLGVDCNINIKDGKLCFDVPGQMNFELKWPDADGKWAFAMMPEAIQLKFNKNAAGEIESLTSYQGGAELDCPHLRADGTPMVTEKPGPFSTEELNKFTGTYHFAPTNLDWKVIVKKGKLAIDVPKQRVFDLKWPDADGKWKVAILPASCAFNKGADGKIESMTWYQGGEIKLPRIADGATTANDLPTVDQVSELRRKSADPEKLKAMGDIEISGKVRAINQGIDGTVHGLANSRGAMLQDIDFGVFGFIRTSCDGERAWTQSVGSEFTELTGDQLAEIKKAGSQFVVSDLKSLFDTVEVVEKSTLNGKDVIVIRGHNTKPEKTSKQYCDAATGLPLKEESSIPIPGIGRLPITITYEDYKDISGVMMPMKIRIQNEANGAMEFTIDRVTPNAKLPADAYVLKASAGS